MGTRRPSASRMWRATRLVAVASLALLPLLATAGEPARATPAGIVEFPLPAGSHPNGISTGPDGNLWFTEYGTGMIGRITPTGTITQFGPTWHGGPWDIVNGPDGNLWFTDAGASGDGIGRIRPDGKFTVEFPLAKGSRPFGITVGGDGLIYFTEAGTSKIGRMTTGGQLTEYPLTAGSGPYGIAPADAPSRAFFTEFSGDRLGVLWANVGRLFQSQLPAGSGPYGICGPFGSRRKFHFVTESSTDKIIEINRKLGIVRVVQLAPGSGPKGIVVGPDANIWFTESTGNRIGRYVVLRGKIREFVVPTGSSSPAEITSGPDGRIWFTEASGDKIGSITPP
jgi:streptogramin lyase